MNDYRGVIPARQYGDSYLVLKDRQGRGFWWATWDEMGQIFSLGNAFRETPYGQETPDGQTFLVVPMSSLLRV